MASHRRSKDQGCLPKMGHGNNPSLTVDGSPAYLKAGEKIEAMYAIALGFVGVSVGCWRVCDARTAAEQDFPFDYEGQWHAKHPGTSYMHARSGSGACRVGMGGDGASPGVRNDDIWGK
ncbi:hypothetical protein M413DRAFT_443306 [Hebeloma cylindrosporum]|uniref:Uncharacterized protein n=1 Tax=Hebeloma cylindrosporum TaxID=76867 RepID=A0A0C3CKG4_HEBCY|nr:hypothetical protein M413DRAFT_443306 [Hebeloma cylindrosporum h7]